MAESGFLEVGCDSVGDVVINHPDLERDDHGVAHIVFSPEQARALAHLLIKHADMGDKMKKQKQEEHDQAAGES